MKVLGTNLQSKAACPGFVLASLVCYRDIVSAVVSVADEISYGLSPGVCSGLERGILQRVCNRFGAWDHDSRCFLCRIFEGPERTLGGYDLELLPTWDTVTYKDQQFSYHSG